MSSPSISSSSSSSSSSVEERNVAVRKKMLDLKEIKIGEMPQNSPWLRTSRMTFCQNGVEKNWDLSRTHNSVAIILFNITRNKLVFVRQFRAAAYYADLPEKFHNVDTQKYPLENGITLELCAGIVDKDLPLVEIARAELREECGYEASASALTQILTFRDVGGTVGKHTLFYAEVTDEMRIHPGGGAEDEGELIEVVEMSAQEANNYISCGDVKSPPSFLYGVLWFLTTKKDRYS